MTFLKILCLKFILFLLIFHFNLLLRSCYSKEINIVNEMKWNCNCNCNWYWNWNWNWAIYDLSLYLFSSFTFSFRITNPSSYTADALDIFLRIVSPKMSATYGSIFYDLLRITENEILPKLKENSGKIRLREFLQVCRESKGRNFLPFFKKKWLK